MVKGTVARGHSLHWSPRTQNSFSFIPRIGGAQHCIGLTCKEKKEGKSSLSNPVLCLIGFTRNTVAAAVVLH